MGSKPTKRRKPMKATDQFKDVRFMAAEIGAPMDKAGSSKRRSTT